MQRVGKIVGVVAFIVILLMPRPEGMTSEAHRLAAITALMVSLWMTDAIPLSVTALIPLVAYPLLGILPSKAVSGKYIDENVLLYLGGFIIALGIEKWGLHRRVALHIVRFIGPGSRKIVLGFMAATGFVSMWTSNTATTLLMIPIGLAMLAALEETLLAGKQESDPEYQQASLVLKRMGTALVLGIAYAASIGGLATPIGTPTNIVAVGIWRDQQELVAQYGDISIGTWMAAFIPLTVLMMLATWGVLTRNVPPLPGADRLGRAFFTERILVLGKPTRAEYLMMGIFLVTAFLWVFRLPLELGVLRIPGWAPPLQSFLVERLGADSVFSRPNAIHDSTVAILMSLLMFVLPARRDEKGRLEPLMDWETIQKGVPWGILLLFGGGLALADALTSTGLSDWIGARLVAQTQGLSPILIVFALCLFVSYLTELTSNVATISALAPVLLGAAASLNVDPRLLLLPAAIAASFGFMLPVGTPPNAIAFGTGRVPLQQMLRHGFWLDLIGAVLTTIATFTIVCPVMGIKW